MNPNVENANVVSVKADTAKVSTQSGQSGARSYLYERDMTRIFTEEGLYETLAHGYRLRARAVKRDAEEGGTYGLLLPLYFDQVHRESGRIVVDVTEYNRRQDDRPLIIPMARLKGRGHAFPLIDTKGDAATLDLLIRMERVALAGIAWSVCRYID